VAKRQRSNREKMTWVRVDLHLHTPGSRDYKTPEVSYLDILQKAESRSLDIIAFTDHNTIAGFRQMHKEIGELTLLKELGRLRPNEKNKLEEYQRLLDKILVLPGFEFTATFGFHVLGIFRPDTPIRQIEHILLTLNVPPDKLDEGSTEVGATSDVLTAYEVIHDAGGLVIAAHVNSAHGVAMQGMDHFGGQTKIAYTQDPKLHALEVTDLESKRHRTTARFFNGSKPEYSRRMHCIQGSDAHRVHRDLKDRLRLGVGDRATEVLLPDVGFQALLDLFQSNDFARTRPFRPAKEPLDHIYEARQEGPSIVQAFHESLARQGGKLYNVMRDICAFANTNGGTIYVGASAHAKTPPAGIESVQEAIQLLRSEVEKKITPPLDVDIDVLDSQSRHVLRISVAKGDSLPYAVDEYKIYVRDETESNLAVRDEIVAMIKKQLASQAEVEPVSSTSSRIEEVPAVRDTQEISPPKTGVEIVVSEERNGTRYYSMRDLRNGNIIHNVTRRSARKLWQYAIEEHQEQPVVPARIEWHGRLGLWKEYKWGGKKRYDFVMRQPNGRLSVFYGVTEDGIHGFWRELIGNGS
jgi:hypothetical protein